MRYTTGWLKLPRKDSASFGLLSYEARGLYFLITRCLDESGLLKLPQETGLRGLCKEIGGVGAADWKRMQDQLQELFDEGSLLWEPESCTLAAPRFGAEQAATTSEAERKKAYRARQAELCAAPQNVPQNRTIQRPTGDNVSQRPAMQILDNVPVFGTSVPATGTNGRRSFIEESVVSSGVSGSSSSAGAAAAAAPPHMPFEVAHAFLVQLRKSSVNGGGIAQLLIATDEPTDQDVALFQSACNRQRKQPVLAEVEEMGRLLALGEWPNRGRGCALNALCSNSIRGGDQFEELLLKARTPPAQAAQRGPGGAGGAAPPRLRPGSAAEAPVACYDGPEAILGLMKKESP